MTIPISRPLFGPEEAAAVAEVLDSGWVVQGPKVSEFEKRFSEYTGIPFSAATTSCTTALQVALSALGLAAGDEVIVPSFTWISTANVVELAGARPVFCDVELQSFNLDITHLESLVGPRTVGIIPVHLFGCCCDIHSVLGIAQRHGLWVVEDAACGFGATVNQQHAGGFGDVGCFSFHPRKSISTGEGGMATTRSEDLDRQMRSYRDHGASHSDRERHVQSGRFLLPTFDKLGYNFRMTDIQGAVGVVQMGRAESILTRRRELAAIYDELLADLEWLALPSIPKGYEHGYQAYVCLFQPVQPDMQSVSRVHEMRNGLMARLEERGIATRQGTHAPPFTELYKRKYGYRPEDFPNAYIAEKASLALPLFAGLTDADAELVADSLSRAYQTAG